MENQFIFDAENLPPKILAQKHRLENDPSSRTNHMEFLSDMEQIHSDIREKVLAQANSYDTEKFSARDVKAALEHERCTVEDFKALLSPAAAPYLEQMAQRAKFETAKHFGNTVYLFTPLYIANYCDNYCVYCGFNRYNKIRRVKQSPAEIEHEMNIIADSGIEEILILTGESRSASDVEYIGAACKLARKYFRMVGLEIYPVNVDEYKYLHECGADYVTGTQANFPVSFRQSGAGIDGRNARRRIFGIVGLIGLSTRRPCKRTACLLPATQISSRGIFVVVPASAPDNQQRQN